ncbi:MAG: tRNA (N(6)-L-threonylcarbamoyladenosine(37)-C(2))-methylthiotransferase MtaB [Pseudomonadota bacterium]
MSVKQTQVHTFGCRLNAYESQVMRDHAQAQGLENAIIVNTCAVTNEAERQGRQAIRKLRREHPEAEIIVTGCGAQIHPETYANMPEVNRVLGNTEKMDIQSFAVTSHPRVKVGDIMTVKETAHHLISGFESRARAFIEIQNGCDHRCTFCSIPFGRGNNRSVPVAAIIEQIRTLAQNDCKEVVLTGVDITGYGSDLPGAPRLGSVVKRIFKLVPELPRLRLSSIDPAEVDEDLWQVLKDEPRLMPHLHISLQAGDDMILKRMKRRHLRQDVIDFCKKARDLRPGVVFGADIIAGFPTETEVMHESSCQIIAECGLTYMHVFPFSPRDGTPAARMPQVPRRVVKQRAARLRALGEGALRDLLQQEVGQEVGTVREVLVEKDNAGRAENYLPVKIESHKIIAPGTIVPVHVKSVQDKTLVAMQILKEVT